MTQFTHFLAVNLLDILNSLLNFLDFSKISTIRIISTIKFIGRSSSILYQFQKNNLRNAFKNDIS
jgi:hypothetical protein